MSGNMNRRNFIGTTAAAAAAITIIPRHVLGGTGFVAANDRINLGFIGVGKQSYTLLDGIGRCKETVIMACCDVDSKNSPNSKMKQYRTTKPRTFQLQWMNTSITANY